MKMIGDVEDEYLCDASYIDLLLTSLILAAFGDHDVRYLNASQAIYN